MEVNGKYYTITELEKMVKSYQKTTVTSFLGNKDIEYYTFLTMSLEDLRELVQVNQYLKSIISTDTFWCEYLRRHYGVQYKTECLHIGQILLKNKSIKTLFTKAIKYQDIAVVKFLLNSNQATIDYSDLKHITYIPLLKVLIPYIDEQKYDNQQYKEERIIEIIDEDNMNVIAQLLDHDRIPISIIKRLLKLNMDKKIYDLLFDYFNMAKLVMPDEFSSTDSTESSSSDSDDAPRRNRSPKRASPKRVVRRKSPPRKK